MNVSAASLSDDSRAARRINWTSTRAPRNQPRSSKPGTPGPVATSRSRSSGRKPAMLAGGFKRRTLNKRETTAVASANAAMAVKDPRSCQRADISSSAIQIVADAANQAVTGWPRTTLAPHPIMMMATASVTRRSQRTWLVIVVNECIETFISNSLKSRRWKARDGWRVAPHDGRPATIRQGPARDLVFTGEPDARLRTRVPHESVERAHPVRVTRDAVVKADDHHSPALRALLVELVELVAQCLLVRRPAPADEREGNDVVEMKRIRDRHEVAALQRHDERLVAARLVDVVQEAEALQNVQGSRRIAHPVRVPPDGPLAGGLYDAFHSVGDEPTFRVRVERVAVLPCTAVRGSLMSTLDDLARQVGSLVDRAADHERRHLDPVLVEQVEEPRDSFVDAVLEEGIGRQVGAALPDRLRNHAASA